MRNISTKEAHTLARNCGVKPRKQWTNKSNAAGGHRKRNICYEVGVEGLDAVMQELRAALATTNATLTVTRWSTAASMQGAYIRIRGCMLS